VVQCFSGGDDKSSFAGSAVAGWDKLMEGAPTRSIGQPGMLTSGHPPAIVDFPFRLYSYRSMSKLFTTRNRPLLRPAPSANLLQTVCVATLYDTEQSRDAETNATNARGAGVPSGHSAEIIPSSPEQGNACAGKRCGSVMQGTHACVIPGPLSMTFQDPHP